MWSVDEIVLRNSDQPRKVELILSSHSANEKLLCSTAAELEDATQPQVCCFVQLPFPLAITEQERFQLKAGRADRIAILSFERWRASVSDDCRLQIDPIPAKASIADRGLFTQMRVFFQNWGRHQYDYPNYLEAITETGLREQPLNHSFRQTGRVPTGVATGPVSYGDIRTPSYFEHELTQAIEHEVTFVIDRFLESYNLVALDDLRPPESHLGLFVMLAPGRVSYSVAPRPVAATLLSNAVVPESVNGSQLEAALRFSRRDLDRYLRRLIAMQRLARQGEPELAAIGCVSAIEWYMNAALGNDVGKPDRRSKPLWRCMESELFSSLPAQLKNRIEQIRNMRNDLAHGSPPERLSAGETRTGALETKEVVATAIELYRTMQMRMSKSSV
jgi:hypothetical protein